MDINVNEKFLPIGTVLSLKKGTTKLMITGYCVTAPEIESTVYDYSACVYPIGYIDTKQACVFNHDSIDKIYHIGFINEEGKSLLSKLKDAYPELIDFALNKKDFKSVTKKDDK